VRSYRDQAEDDLHDYKASLNSSSSAQLPDHRRKLKLAEKELALYEKLMDKTKQAKKQSEAKYQESKKLHKQTK